MKKAAIIIVIAGMVVLDLILSGMNVILGLLLIIGAGLFAYLMDSMNHEPRRTTSITRAVVRTVSCRKPRQRPNSALPSDHLMTRIFIRTSVFGRFTALLSRAAIFEMTSRPSTTSP